MSNLEYWIWFSSLRGLRSVTRRALLERFGDAGGVYFAEEAELKRLEGIRPEEVAAVLERDLTAAANALRRCADLDVDVVTLRDAAYPERLRNIPDPPGVLYVKGRLPDVDALPVVTIVGTRSCTPYGSKMARKLGYEVASLGGAVCTGLAGGADSRAAEGALMAGGTVIGVLGTAINEVYPSWNGNLFEDVRVAGALVSEYPPDTPMNKEFFPARNRIMAGLCVAAVVAEAPDRSGSLITAHRALDYGREIFAVPGNADAPNSRGSNNLLREGASIAETGWDVLKDFAARFPDRITEENRRTLPKDLAIPQENQKAEQLQRRPPRSTGEEKELPPEVEKGAGFFKLRVRTRKPAETPPENATPLAGQLSGLSETQLKIIGVMEKPKMHVDDIVDLSRLPAASVLSELTVLQIKGYVRQEPGKRFTLNLTK